MKDIGNNKNYMIQHAYTHFLVSLDDFLLNLKSGGIESPASFETGKACQVSVGFIQVFAIACDPTVIHGKLCQIKAF